ncbi:protein PAXX-like [Corticium candelabrum]|uniref:protein PAXX-like n=1 Tax=Corticium candelabrum TaxID=121492 RepID=UPI002E25D540|nr:protein PAXX-like [Corticium candelabrum]
MSSLHVHCKLQAAGRNYVCYTRQHEQLIWFLVLTDGIDVWRTEVNEEYVERHRGEVHCADISALIQEIRQAIVTCQLVVDRQADRLSLSIGHWPLHFDLFEVSSSERKTELQHFIFWLADLSTDLKARLQVANSKIEELSQKQKMSETAAAAALYEPEAKKRSKQPKLKRQVGTSLINPSSKKKKSAGGVVFD